MKILMYRKSFAKDIRNSTITCPFVGFASFNNNEKCVNIHVKIFYIVGSLDVAIVMIFFSLSLIFSIMSMVIMVRIEEKKKKKRVSGK